MIKLNDGKYIVMRGQSIFTNRRGLQDCVIMQQGNHGGRYDGKLYATIIRIACETGEILRAYLDFPKGLTLDKLKDMAMID